MIDINIKLNNREDAVVIALFIFIIFSNTFTLKLTEGAFKFSSLKSPKVFSGQTCGKETQGLSHDVLRKSVFLQCFDFHC